MAIIPKRNLPPDAGKWARWVEDNVGTLLRDIEALRANSRATAQQINATSRAASTVVADVQAQETQATRDREIEQETQAALTETTENLEQARADLEAAQEWIDTTGMGLGGRLDDAEQALEDAETALTDLENVQLPALRDRLDDAEYDVKHISAEWITGGTIDTERLNAIEIAAETGQFLDIDVSQLVASEALISEAVVEKLWADVVRARKIGTDMLLVGSGTNLLEDPNFTYAPLTEERRYRSGATVSEAGLRQNGYMYYGGTDITAAKESSIPVQAGDTYRLRVPVSDYTGDDPYIRVEYWKTSGSYSIGLSDADTTVTDGVAEAVWTVPGDAVSFHLRVYRPSSSGWYTVGPGASVVQMIDSPLIVDGGIIARHLNVTVPEGDTGMELQPEGMRIIGGQDGTDISLRSDEEKTIRFIRDGEDQFSVDESGLITGNALEIGSIQLDRVDMLERLYAFPRGVIARVHNNANAVVGTEDARLLMVTFTTPPEGENRLYRIGFRGHTGTGSPRGYFQLKQAVGTLVLPSSSNQRTWYLPGLGAGHSQSFEFSALRSVSDWGWPADTKISVAVFVRSLDSGGTFNFTSSNRQEMWVEDVGPATVESLNHTPWVPTGSGQTPNDPGTTTDFKKTFTPTWVRSYIGTGGRYNYNDARAYFGYYLSGNGNLTSAIGFSRSQIQSFTSGGTVVGARVYLKNDHTYSSAGARISLGVHQQSSAANSWGAVSGKSVEAEASFSKGQGRWLGLGSKTGGFAGGTNCGVIIQGTSPYSTNYGYFNAGATRLELTVRK